MISED